MKLVQYVIFFVFLRVTEEYDTEECPRGLNPFQSSRSSRMLILKGFFAAKFKELGSKFKELLLFSLGLSC